MDCSWQGYGDHFTENVVVINYEEFLEKLSETNYMYILRALVNGEK
jgi:hypothetical protein